jgi:hypothetical protein
MARDARTAGHLARLQVQVEDLETLLAHHDEEAHVLRRLLQAQQHLPRLRGEQYTPDVAGLERLREVGRERANDGF